MADLRELFQPLREEPAIASAGLPSIEARARALRRRRHLWQGAVSIAVVVGLVAAAAVSGVFSTGRSSRVISVPGPPAGIGKLAVVTSTGLDIIDGGRVVHVVHMAAVAPAWSPDGQFIAYLDGQPGRLWLADASGKARLLIDAQVTDFAWSPDGGHIAVMPDGGGLLVLTPAGVRETLVRADAFVTSMRWSPDGSLLAYSEAFPVPSAGPANRTDRLYLRSPGAPSSTPVSYSPGEGDGIILGGWWPSGHGLYLWEDPMHSGSIAADGLTLKSVSLPDGKATSLGTTLATPRVLAFSPDGSRVAVMSGGWRFIGQAKDLRLCAVGSAACDAWLQPEGTVSVEPSWSPDGRQVVFVRGASSEKPMPSDWLPTSALYVRDVASGVEHRVAGSPAGVGDPAFSLDGEHLVYQHEGGLWLLDLATGVAHQLADGLPPLMTQWPAPPAYAWHR